MQIFRYSSVIFRNSSSEITGTPSSRAFRFLEELDVVSLLCGYVYEGEQPPVECPVCHVDGSKFIEQKAEKSWAAEHVVGVGKAFGADVPADVQKETR